MRRTVWAVTSGEYSDYSVEAIFTSLEEAEKVAGMNIGSLYLPVNIEEFVLCDSVEDAVLGERWRGVAVWDGTQWVIEAEFLGVSLNREPPATEPRGPGAYGRIICMGRSEEQVRKALSEYIAAGPTPDGLVYPFERGG